MNLKNDLISTLSSNIGSESNKILKQNVAKFKISDTLVDSDIRFRIRSEKETIESSRSIKQHIDQEIRHFYQFENTPSRKFYSLRTPLFITIIKYIAIIGIVSFVLIFGGKLISQKLSIGLLSAILILLAIVFIIFILYVASYALIEIIYNRLERKFDSIQINEKKITNEFSDEVYAVIANTYETLSDFRIERERQAKNSYNAAIGLIISGIIIVFSGVYLLFRKSITEGALASSIGAISNIIGGTILKFYKDTNDRMDKLNSDLFILNSTKVQYALILKINDVPTRDRNWEN